MKNHYDLYGRSWYQRNKERNLQRGYEWRKNNKEKARMFSDRWQKEQGSIYWSWSGMKRRCDYPKNKAYEYYGGRGITYPEKWKTFKGFKDDMEETYKEGLEIDRINTNGNYSKENCRWVTQQENKRNKRKHIWVNYKRKKMLLVEYAELVGINPRTLRSRYYLGMSMKKIMTPTKL